MGISYKIVGGWGVVIDPEKHADDIIKILDSAGKVDYWGEPFTIDKLEDDPHDVLEHFAGVYGLKLAVAGDYFTGENMSYLIGPEVYSKNIYGIDKFGFWEGDNSQPENSSGVWNLLNDLNTPGLAPKNYFGTSVG